MYRYWSDRDRDIAVSMSESFHSLRAIAQKVGRSETAVRRQLSRLPYGAPITKASGGKCQRDVARFFGVHVCTVRYWIKLGHLTAHAISSRHIRIPEESIVAFLGNESTWHHWSPHSIPDRRTREWAITQRRGLTFLSTTGVALRLRVSCERVNRMIYRGELKAVQVTKHGAWQVRSDWLEAYQATPRNQLPKDRGRVLTAEEAAYLRQWRPTMSYRALASHLPYGPTYLREKCVEMGLVNEKTKINMVKGT